MQYDLLFRRIQSWPQANLKQYAATSRATGAPVSLACPYRCVAINQTFASALFHYPDRVGANLEYSLSPWTCYLTLSAMSRRHSLFAGHVFWFVWIIATHVQHVSCCVSMCSQIAVGNEWPNQLQITFGVGYTLPSLFTQGDSWVHVYALLLVVSAFLLFCFWHVQPYVIITYDSIYHWGILLEWSNHDWVPVIWAVVHTNIQPTLCAPGFSCLNSTCSAAKHRCNTSSPPITHVMLSFRLGVCGLPSSLLLCGFASISFRVVSLVVFASVPLGTWLLPCFSSIIFLFQSLFCHTSSL